MDNSSLPQSHYPETKQREVRDCIHCWATGWIFEPTEDPLVDAESPCHMCGGTGRRSVFLYPKRTRA